MRSERLFPQDGPLVIAEIGGNHGGSLDLAKGMVDAALAAGGRVVKFQTYRMEAFVAPDQPAYGEFAPEALSYDQFRELSAYCHQRGAVFLSTPFDLESADLLEELDVPAFKIASGDLTFLSLLEHVAKKGRPILLSTGGAQWEDIDRAVEAIRSSGDPALTLLHCTAAYPAPDAEANLRIIPSLKERYGVDVGFSDHTLGVDVALAAVGLGVTVVEKHFTTDQGLPGGDNEMSILPHELKRLVEASRRIWLALGSDHREPTKSERQLLPNLRRSLALGRDMAKGQEIRAVDLTAIRPGTGIPPYQIDSLVGRRLSRGLPAFHLVQSEDLEP
jgi:N,N'-diacetyllegionaminate synthase